MKDAARVRIFPPAVPVLVIAAGIGIDHLWPLVSKDAVAAPVRWLGGFIILASILGLGLWSVILMRRSGQSENPWKPTTRIIERGPFRLTRNPMYLQMVLVCIGAALLLASIWILLLTPLCALLLQKLAIIPEERYLEAKFGDEYRSYKARVRRWL